MIGIAQLKAISCAKISGQLEDIFTQVTPREASAPSKPWYIGPATKVVSELKIVFQEWGRKVGGTYTACDMMHYGINVRKNDIVQYNQAVH